MGTICSSHFSLYRAFLSTRPTRLGEPPPVSLLLWSRGGLVIAPESRHFLDLCSDLAKKVVFVVSSGDKLEIKSPNLLLPYCLPGKVFRSLSRSPSLSLQTFCARWNRQEPDLGNKSCCWGETLESVGFHLSFGLQHTQSGGNMVTHLTRTGT